MSPGVRWLAALALAAASTAAQADGGRLLATGGATQVEGAAGGGLVPWAVLAGYGTREQDGGTAFYTRVDTGDYALDAAGVAWTFRNRLELSLARQRLTWANCSAACRCPGPRCSRTFTAPSCAWPGTWCTAAGRS